MARLFRLAARGAATAILRQGAEVEVPSVAEGVTFEAISYEGWDLSIFTKE